MANEVIKPCPFCGGEADVEEVPCASLVNPDAVAFTVSCFNPAEEACPAYSINTSWSRRSEAIAAWNRRAPDASAKGDNHD